jgi:neutral ceramidase
VNRRNNREAEVPEILARGEPLQGPVDHSVPVLAVHDAQGRLLAVAFGYACHPTTLSDNQWCGDYPGYAQAALEQRYPGAAALFWTGCGGDQNPLPRRTVALCERYGAELAGAVAETLARPLRPLAPELRAAYETVTLEFDRRPAREELQRDAVSPNSVRARWAKRMLALLEREERQPESCPYGVQAWRLGGEQLWLALGGEAVVDYALRFKQEFGPATWVAGYAHDMVGYVPSRRVWREGGYEAEFIYEYGWLAYRWTEDTEDRVAAAVHRLAAQVGAVRR